MKKPLPNYEQPIPAQPAVRPTIGQSISSFLGTLVAWAVFIGVIALSFAFCLWAVKLLVGFF
jgi:uncharacterized membrane protein